MFSTIDHRVPLGLAITVLGVVLTVLSFSVVEAWSIQRFWPLLIVVSGLLRIAERANQWEGWLLLIVGGTVQLSNLGLFVLPAHEVMRYWPLTVVVAGLSEAASRNVEVKGEGLAVLFLGAWLQLSYFGEPHFSLYRAWPLALAAAGPVMAWRGLRPARA